MVLRGGFGMIHKVLNAYFAKRKSKKLTNDVVLTILVDAIYVVIIIALLFLKWNIYIKLVIQITTSILFLAFVVRSENKRSQKWETDFNEYNTNLNEMADILKTFKYQNAFGNGNWYSEEKIEYLIASAEKWITEQNESKAKLEKLAHVIVLPIVGFVAAVIQNNASVEDAISIGVAAIVVVGIGYVVDKGASMLIDSIINTTSIDKMTMLMNLLQDLKARDFT